MIIHVWMHWFWITTPFQKIFLNLAVQMISIACIYHGESMAEAGLLKNGTFIIFPSRNPIDSGQIGGGENVSLTGNGNGGEIISPVKDSVPEVVTSGSDVEIGRSTIGSDEIFQSAEISEFEEEDTYGGVGLEPFPLPVKKFAKHSRQQSKYGKIKGGTKKIGDESVEDSPAGKKTETVKPSDSSNVFPPEVEGNFSSSSEEPETGNFTREGNGRTDPGSGEILPSTDEESFVKEPETGDGNPETTGTDALNVAADESEEPFNNETLVIENKIQETGLRATLESFLFENRVAAATSSRNFDFGQSGLDAGSVTGIALGILVVFGLFGGIFFILYRRRYSNKPQVLHEKCSNLDSSGYIDDTSLRENSEEMYSLDNDSFLNSLEAMTIQNYWTENVKHTKL